MNSSEIVNKVWNYAHVLRDDGVGYGDYVEQITYLIFLKMADERETAQIMVESNFFLPGNFIVTLAALGALLILMNIVLFVTAVTGGINFFCFSANGMTCFTDQLFMRAVECEISVCVVIKFCILPSRDDMTVLAFFTVQLVMNIICTMAAVTITRFFV